MVGFSFPFGSHRSEELFDGYDEFVPEHLPDPGPSLERHDVLVDRAHAAFHALTRELFEERSVYDMTFGYNLARLNLDRRHEDAGFRYGVEIDDPSVLRAEFTPTTEFCPQTRTLTVGAFRAWNGPSDRHEYDLVRVRTGELHHRSGTINGQLAALEERYLETGDLSADPPAKDGNDTGTGSGSTSSPPF